MCPSKNRDRNSTSWYERMRGKEREEGKRRRQEDRIRARIRKAAKPQDPLQPKHKIRVVCVLLRN